MIKDLQKLIWSFLPVEERMRYELQLDLQNRVWSFLGFEDQAICDLQTGCPPVNFGYLALYFAKQDDDKSIEILDRYHPDPIDCIHMVIWQNATKCIKALQHKISRGTFVNLVCSCQTHTLLYQFSLDEILQSNPHDAMAWGWISDYHPAWNRTYYRRLLLASPGIDHWVSEPKK